jgi:hypothetical protein
MPNWGLFLLGVSLKRRQLYTLKLDAAHSRVKGALEPLFQTQNRYRDIAIHPDRKTFFIITESQGLTTAIKRESTKEMNHPGMIFQFRYRNRN